MDVGNLRIFAGRLIRSHEITKCKNEAFDPGWLFRNGLFGVWGCFLPNTKRTTDTGPKYNEIKDLNDFRADFLPPDLFIQSAYLECHELEDVVDNNGQENLIRTIKNVQSRFENCLTKWEKTTPRRYDEGHASQENCSSVP